MAGQQLPDDLFAWLRDLDRRLVALERSPQLTQASVKDGALTVFDAAGVARVKIGKDGSDYGVKVFDAAGLNAVTLAQLAFAQSFVQVDAAESTTSTTFVDLATVGPSLTVTVGPSGRAVVLGGAFTQCTVTNQTAVIGLKIDAGAPITFGALSNNTGGALQVSVAAGYLAGGLAAGSHTFKLQYRQTLGGSTATWEARWLMVFPL